METTIHDCLVSVTGEKPSKEQVQSIQKDLPEDIQLLGNHWGWNDTEVRDKIYLWVKNNL